MHTMPLVLGLFCVTHSHGQGGAWLELAEAGPQEAWEAEPTPITDDGSNDAALAPARQLLISFRSESAAECEVQVLDEQGCCVRKWTRPSHIGRNMVPIDATRLAKGRYVVRVQEGEAVHVTRFLRP